jgi:hypothetical protein
LFEDCGCIVEHCIDTGPLLEEHGYGCDNYPLEHCFCPEEGADGDELELESIQRRKLAEMGPVFCTVRFSKSDWALISRNSSSTSS